MFRLITVHGRSALESNGEWFDLATLSGDDALGDPLTAVARFNELHAWNDLCATSKAGGSVSSVVLDAPVPAPRQVFAIGLNYREHAGESGMEIPPAPLTFAKFASCVVGPTAEVPLSGSAVDWEAEIVAVIGTQCSHVAVDDAWSVVAGLTLGQDISDRVVQFTGAPPQFGLGKSFPAYGPTGPALVSLDSFANPDDIGLWCEVNDERMQDARTTELIFSIPVLVAYLSSICTLYPGDLIFTGTPSGIGAARGQFLVPGDDIVTGAEVIGELRNRCVPGAAPLSW